MKGAGSPEKEGDVEMTGFSMISYRELDAWLEQGRGFQLIDLRAPERFARERLWGSVNIPTRIWSLRWIGSGGTARWYFTVIAGPRAWQYAGICGKWAMKPSTWPEEY